MAIKIDLSSLDSINCQLIATNYLYIMNYILATSGIMNSAVT